MKALTKFKNVVQELVNRFDESRKRLRGLLRRFTNRQDGPAGL
jgi:hypothetical protein